ncbi:hypothetical protein AOLI_G00174110 [Acnodon oligacanthus]
MNSCKFEDTQAENLHSVLHHGHILLCSHIFKRFLQTNGRDQGEAEVTALMTAKIIKRNRPQCPKPGIIFLIDDCYDYHFSPSWSLN